MRKNSYELNGWNHTQTKVAIVVPTRDTVYTQFAYSLQQLVKISSVAGLDIFTFFNSSTILLNQRNDLLKQALDIKAKYIFWLDSDMIVPSTALLKLLNHKKQIVGCNYMKRSLPVKTVAYENVNDWESWVPLKKHEKLVKVEGVGMGCLLMETEIFQKINKPYFEFVYEKDTDDWHGEDFNLLKKFKEANISTFIDMNLSEDVYHLGTYAFGRDIGINKYKAKNWKPNDNKY